MLPISNDANPDALYVPTDLALIAFNVHFKEIFRTNRKVIRPNWKVNLMLIVTAGGWKGRDVLV